MTTLGERLIASAKEARAIARGEMEPAAVYVPPRVDVAAVRKRLKLSQKAFAETFRLPLGTVRDWEQGRRVPDRPAQILLNVIDKNPDAVKKALEVTGAVSPP
jgi:putative transcriptional regulator